jgi:hypothetical protein
MAQAPDRGLMGAGTYGAGAGCFELDLQQTPESSSIHLKYSLMICRS